MAKEVTDKSRYPSKYSPSEYVTGAQYIIELVCEYRARHLKIDLPRQFWKLPEWASYFSAQTRSVHKLLSSFDERAIINTVKNSKVRSLLPRWIPSAVAKEQKKIDGAKKQKEQENINKPKSKKGIIDIPTRRTVHHGTSAMDKLLALDIEAYENGKEDCEEKRD